MTFRFLGSVSRTLSFSPTGLWSSPRTAGSRSDRQRRKRNFNPMGNQYTEYLLLSPAIGPLFSPRCRNCIIINLGVCLPQPLKGYMHVSAKSCALYLPLIFPLPHVSPGYERRQRRLGSEDLQGRSRGRRDLRVPDKQRGQVQRWSQTKRHG